MNIAQSSLLAWSVGIIFAIPLLIIVFNELIDRLQRRESQYVEIFIMVRDVVLPLMATLMVLRFVFVVSEQNMPTRILSTIFWSVLTIGVFRVSRNIIGTGEYEPNDWRSYVPHLFLRLPPYAIMGYIIFHIIQNVWALPVQEMATTLGIGSIVIAFALQDTLSNLVSGLLLVVNSPFKTGEWIHVGDVEGKVVAVNWRYTSLETWNGDLIVIPNGTIAGESIENHSRPRGRTSITQAIEFAATNPPNLIKQMLVQTMQETPGILNDPKPNVVVTNIGDPMMGYEVEFWIEDFGDKPDIHDNFMTRVWYAIQRYNIAAANTAFDLYTFDGATATAGQEVTTAVRADRLRSLAGFSILPDAIIQMLGDSSDYKRFALSETLIEMGAEEAGIYVLLTGQVQLSMVDEDGDVHFLETLLPGGFFGEAGLFGRPMSPVVAIAETDTEILIIPHAIMTDVINRQPRFSNGIDALINQRRVIEKRITEKYSTHRPDELLGSEAEFVERTSSLLQIFGANGGSNGGANGGSNGGTNAGTNGGANGGTSSAVKQDAKSGKNGPTGEGQ